MDRVCNILQLVVDTKGTKARAKILKENESEKLKYILNLSFNPYIILGVKEFSILKQNYFYKNEDIFPILKELVNSLISKKLKGNEAKQEIGKFLGGIENPITQKWIKLALKKNIKCGVDIKTINKIFPNLIPTFDLGLCDVVPSKDIKNNNLPKGNWALEPKLDGLRCIVFINEEGEITFYSRTGKELYNLEHIKKELSSLCLFNTIIDGEIFAGNWDNSISITHTQSHHLNKTEAIYYIFDILTKKEWEDKISNVYIKRKEKISSLLYGKNFKYIKLVPTIIVDNSFEKANETYLKFINEGFEGAILKELNSTYPFKRGKNWLKWKPTITVDLEIIGWEEGEGRNKGKLGAFLCKHIDGEIKDKIIKVGGGYSDELRSKFWEEKEQMVNQTIEVEAQEITKDGSLRFPVFSRLRIDK